MDLSTFFDGVFVINLDKREDRWEWFLDMKERVGWPFVEPERVRATDGRLVPPPVLWPDRNRGAWGCLLSHLRIMEDAMHRGMDRILVLEDDVVFVDHLPEKMQQHIRELPKEWDQWYPGGQNLGKKVSRVSKHLVRSDNVNRTHAYAVQGEGLRKVFRWCLDMQQWKSPYHIDHHFGRLQKDSSFVALLSSPRLMGQREGISDIGRKMWKINMWDFKDETSLLISEPVRVDMEPYKPPSMKNPVPLPQVVRATAGGRMGRSYFMMPGGAHR